MSVYPYVTFVWLHATACALGDNGPCDLTLRHRFCKSSRSTRRKDWNSKVAELQTADVRRGVSSLHHFPPVAPVLTFAISQKKFSTKESPSVLLPAKLRPRGCLGFNCFFFFLTARTSYELAARILKAKSVSFRNIIQALTWSLCLKQQPGTVWCSKQAAPDSADCWHQFLSRNSCRQHDTARLNIGLYFPSIFANIAPR